MKEIVVISGKGGTGKTSITAALAYLAKREIVLADCDVDAADLHLLMKPDFSDPQEFYSGEKAHIHAHNCTSCGICSEKCRFDAISIASDHYSVNEWSCEGCGYCARVCPENAIIMYQPLAGHWYTSAIKTGTQMIHADLEIGADNSGKLVAQVKKSARDLAEKLSKELILVDGSPGIGCPVISSLAGATYVLLITEPTVSGIHDLKRVHALVQKFNLSCGCVINKADINRVQTKKIKQFLQKNTIPLLAEIPYHYGFAEAITQGQTIVERNHPTLNNLISTIWEAIK